MDNKSRVSRSKHEAANWLAMEAWGGLERGPLDPITRSAHPSPTERARGNLAIRSRAKRGRRTQDARRRADWSASTHSSSIEVKQNWAGRPTL